MDRKKLGWGVGVGGRDKMREEGNQRREPKRLFFL